MGFRCPACHRDFGFDKISFLKHIEVCENAELVYNYFADNEAFKNDIKEFCGFADRLKTKTDKLGCKAEREAFYKELENGTTNSKHL